MGGKLVRIMWSGGEGGFLGFIRDMGLLDIPCKGKKFGWVSGDGKSKSRIDRFLMSYLVMERWGVVG